MSFCWVGLSCVFDSMAVDVSENPEAHGKKGGSYSSPATRIVEAGLQSLRVSLITRQSEGAGAASVVVRQ